MPDFCRNGLSFKGDMNFPDRPHNATHVVGFLLEQGSLVHEINLASYGKWLVFSISPIKDKKICT